MSYTVFVNGSLKKLDKEEYTCEELIKLVYPNSKPALFTVVSTDDKCRDPHDYDLDDLVKISELMRINIDLTIGA